MQNYNVAVREWNEQIIFLRKIVAGTADKSYGIQVARLAGLPPEIIQRAKSILETLEGDGGARVEEGNGDEDESTAITAKPPKKKAARSKSKSESKAAGVEESRKISSNDDPNTESPAPQLQLFD